MHRGINLISRDFVWDKNSMIQRGVEEEMTGISGELPKVLNW